MPSETVALPRADYEALLARNEDLRDALAAQKAENAARVPHEVALAMMRGESGVRAFRKFRRVTLRGLSERTGIAPSYLSEIERGAKPGSVAALSRIAAALDTTIDALTC